MQKTIAKCPVCGYPIALTHEGETRVCDYCGEHLIASQGGIGQGVTIPTPLFAGLLGFAFGVLLGPALLSSTTAGSRWLEQQSVRRISK